MHLRLLKLAQSTRVTFIFTVFFGFLTGLMTIGQAWLLSSTINGVFLEEKTLSEVTHWMRFLLLVITVRAVLVWLSEVFANHVAVSIKTDLRVRLFAHILALGPGFSGREKTGELTAAAMEGVEALDAYYSQYLPQVVISALVPLSILVVVLPLDPLSGFILLITAPLIPFFMYLIGKGAEGFTSRQFKTLRLLSAFFLDSLQGLSVLKHFGQSRDHSKKIAQASNKFRDTTLKVLKITFLSAFALEILATLSTAIIAVEIGLRLLYGRMEFREALFILILAPEFYLPLRMLGLRFHAGMNGISAAGRVFTILDTPIKKKDLRSETGIENMPDSEKSFFSTIELTHISFAYPDETEKVLKDVTFSISSGQRIAIIGASGAGKTTVANLFLRFTESYGGIISVDGKPLKEIDPECWRKNISWVPQKPYLFHDTVEANICVGKPDASKEEVARVARSACLHEFIETLPNGYDTVIGEGGGRFSSGQAQRLAIARAFLKNAPILLLDEPTSSLDPETESMIESSIRLLMKGRTVITFAHRLNTIYQADKILVLEAGSIVESGTHEELLAQKGIYVKMINAASPIMEAESVKDLSPKPHPLAGDSGYLPSTSHPAPSIIRQSSVFFRLLRFLCGSWHRVALSVLFSTLTIGASVALMGTSAWLISTAALHSSIAALGVSIAGVRFFGISRGVFRYIERLLSHNVTFCLLASLRVWFYEKLEPLAPARLMQSRGGDILARIVGDVEILENFYIRVAGPPVTAVFVAALTSSFLALYDLGMAVVLIGFFLVAGLVLPVISQLLSKRAGTEMVSLRARLSVQIVDGIQGMADIISFGKTAERLKKMASDSKDYGGMQRRLANLTGLFSGLSLFWAHLGMWSILFIAISRVGTGQIDGVMLACLVLSSMASFEAVTPLPLAAQMWNVSREAASRLFEIADTEPEVKDDIGHPIDTNRLSIEFSDLSFTYPGQEAPALKNITFKTGMGNSIAIVGPSGAGKSTLAGLLLRFWDYRHGEILLGDHSIKDYGQDEVRKQFSVAGQNSYFFNSTIRQNLLMGHPGASQDEIRDAARKVKLHDFIEGLPNGYDTIIGEQGVRLSGGERQRLAVARALLKKAPILILDEPTANLDPLTEQEVLETLFALMKERTTLLITHRLVGLENVDDILVMNHGRMVEKGKHADLLEIPGGLYRRMWDLQNRIRLKRAAVAYQAP